MLIYCPECELQVSDKAVVCPHCGYPLNFDRIVYPSKKSNRKKRLPNGFGQISKIKGQNLRKPYRAMVTEGKNEYGKPISKLLSPVAYFETYNEAYAALMKYHQDPKIANRDMTMMELFEEWSKTHSKDLSTEKTMNNYTFAWDYVSDVYNMRVRDVKYKAIQTIIESANKEGKPATSGIKFKIKMVLNMLFDYALKLELVDKNYARIYDLPKDVKKSAKKTDNEHFAFSDKELDILWNNSNDKNVAMIIVQCYTGWRPGELIKINLSDIDLEKWTMRGGAKTEAGIDRMIPIHSKIRRLVERQYRDACEIGSDTLMFNKDLSPMIYQHYHYRFYCVLKQLGIDKAHRPHDPRKTFVTNAKRFGMDEYAIKRIVGHKIDDITESIYTERSMEWLREEIEKIR